MLWRPVLEAPGVTFVNLQYGDCDEEIALAKAEFGVDIWQPPGIDLKQDLDDVAALCCAMDLIVGFSNATIKPGRSLRGADLDADRSVVLDPPGRNPTSGPGTRRPGASSRRTSTTGTRPCRTSAPPCVNASRSIDAPRPYRATPCRHRISSGRRTPAFGLQDHVLTSSTPLPLAILQARMSSTRLPGKVLADLAGAPMILRQIERLQRATRLNRIVVATSDQASDDPAGRLPDRRRRSAVSRIAGRRAGPLYRRDGGLRPGSHRGPPDRRLPARRSGLIDQTLDLHLRSGADYTSNTPARRSFAKGLDVEVFESVALKIAADETVDPYDHEHVTPFLYRHPRRFKVAGLEQGPTRATCAGRSIDPTTWTSSAPCTMDSTPPIRPSRPTTCAPSCAAGRTWPPWGEIAAYDIQPAHTVVLRDVTEPDRQRLLDWRNSPEVAAFMYSDHRSAMPSTTAGSTAWPATPGDATG
jgi:spore coat polysaccharide biosynthesis protein SpsF